MNWRGWCLAVASVLAALLLPAHAQTQPESQRRVSSPELQALMATTVGAQPGREMHWPQVLDQLHRARDATRLRSALLDLWLRQAAGEPLPPAQTVAQMLEQARSTPPLNPADAVDARWLQAFRMHLQLRRPPAAVPVPEDIESLRAQLTEVTPGLWLHRDTAGTPRSLFFAVELVNQGALAFPATRFTLRGGGAPSACELPRGGAPRLLEPGQSAVLLCQLSDMVVLGQPPQALAWLDGAAARGPWRMEPAPLDTEATQRLVADALAAPMQTERDTWLRNRQQAVSERVATKLAEDQARQRARDYREKLVRRAKILGLTVASTVGYVLIARWHSVWLASTVLWVVGMLVCVPAGLSLLRANWADSWGGVGAIPLALVLFAAPTVVALNAARFYRFVGRMWTDERYRRSVIWGIAALLALYALELLYTILRRVI